MNTIIDKLTVKVLKAMTIAEFTQYAKEVIEPKFKNRSEGFGFRFPYALNCRMEEKMTDCSKQLRYTAFLNNSGRLCHIVSPDDSDFILRMRFHRSIKSYSEKKQRIAIWMKAHKWIDIGECPK